MNKIHDHSGNEGSETNPAESTYRDDSRLPYGTGRPGIASNQIDFCSHSRHSAREIGGLPLTGKSEEQTPARCAKRL